MEKFLLLGGEVAGVTATLLAGYVTLLFYRAPNHARWLESDGATTAVMIALMAAVISSLGALVMGMTGLVEDPLASMVAAFAIFAAIAWGLWKALRMNARLQAADEGRSPFRIGGYTPLHKPRRRRLRGGA